MSLDIREKKILERKQPLGLETHMGRTCMEKMNYYFHTLCPVGLIWRFSLSDCLLKDITQVTEQCTATLNNVPGSSGFEHWTTQKIQQKSSCFRHFIEEMWHNIFKYITLHWLAWQKRRLYNVLNMSEIWLRTQESWGVSVLFKGQASGSIKHYR